jgi:hypothetical protein
MALDVPKSANSMPMVLIKGFIIPSERAEEKLKSPTNLISLARFAVLF